MNTEQERAAFEWWASDEGESPRATERVGECYKLAQIQSYWMAWQARAALQAECEKLRKDAEALMEALTMARETLAYALRANAPDYFTTDADIARHVVIQRIDTALAVFRKGGSTDGE